MKPGYFSVVVLFLCIVSSCDDQHEAPPYIDPRYAKMVDISEITSNSATFHLAINLPVTKVADGYMVDEKYFDHFIFFYSTDPDQDLRLWQQAEGTVADESGSYNLGVSDLAPGTRYFVKAAVVIAPRKQQQYNLSITASVLEFETKK
jgi:hypothetical protein